MSIDKASFIGSRTGVIRLGMLNTVPKKIPHKIVESPHIIRTVGDLAEHTRLVFLLSEV